MTNNNYYEWNERFLNSRASDNIIDDLNIDQSVDIDWDVEQTFSGGIDLSGDTLQKVGGTTDASVGEIRLGNGSTINARNSGDSGDFGISFTSSDTISMDTAQNLRPTSEPSTPTSGTHLFVDSSDNNLKAKSTDGDVITVVTT